MNAQGKAAMMVAAGTMIGATGLLALNAKNKTEMEEKFGKEMFASHPSLKKFDNSEEGYLFEPILNDKLDLSLVQVITRHGARTPLSPFKTGKKVENDQISKFQSHAPYHTNQLSTVPIPSNLEHNKTDYRNRLYAKRYIPNRQSLEGDCSRGALTEFGLRQMYTLGSNLRTHYGEKLSFLPKKYEEDTIFVRSTDMERTQQSAMSLMLGLIQPSTRGKKIIPIHTIEPAKENMYPRSSCRRYGQIRRDMKSSSLYAERVAQRQQLVEELHKAFGISPEHALSSWQPSSYEGLNNSLTAHKLNQVPLPKGLSPEIAAKVAEEAAFEVRLKTSRKESVRLGIGRFVAELVEMLEKKDNDIKFALYSGHDNTLSPLITALCGHEALKEAPPICSALIVEKYEQKKVEKNNNSNGDNSNDDDDVSNKNDEGGDKTFVRIIYNGEPMKLCAKRNEEGEDDMSYGGTLCDWSIIGNHVKSYIPQNYEKECIEK